jgi:hypothetical protein
MHHDVVQTLIALSSNAKAPLHNQSASPACEAGGPFACTSDTVCTFDRDAAPCISADASTENGNRKSKRRRMRSVRLSGEIDDSVRGRESDRDCKRPQPVGRSFAGSADPAVLCGLDPSTSGTIRMAIPGLIPLLLHIQMQRQLVECICHHKSVML